MKKRFFKSRVGLIVATMLASNSLEAMQPQQQGEIKFYDQNAPFYEFTNFFEAPFEEKFDPNKAPNTWKTSEHYFQGKKFNTPNTRSILTQILNASTPRDALNIAQKNSSSVRPNWHGTTPGTGVKDSVMMDALRLKFTSHPQLAALLLSTDGMSLVENAGANDSYWGNGPNGQGENMLGKLLVKLRAELFNNPGQIKDCSNITVRVAGPSNQELSRLGRKTYFDQVLNQICNKQSVSRFAQQQPVQPQQPQQRPSQQQMSKVGWNQNYRGPSTSQGFGTRVSESISSRFTGLSQTPSVNITLTKNMLIVTQSTDDAKGIANTLTNQGMRGVAIDNNNPKNVFIQKDSISYFLKSVLGFDDGFILKYKQHNKIS